MLNHFVDYSVSQAQEKFQVGDEFKLSDIFNPKDWNYLTEDAHRELNKLFKSRISNSVDGIVLRLDNGIDSKYEKVSNINKNVNYFANKVY